MTTSFVRQFGRLSILARCAIGQRLVCGLLITAGQRKMGWALDIEAGLVVFYVSLHLIWGRSDV